LRLPDTKRASLRKSVRWDHLPHEPLTLEIDSRISHREPSEADQDVRQAYLRERLRKLKREEHDEYINRIAIELKRELRICRDVYRDHLKQLNNKSLTAKTRLALDFAVAPMASKRLREESITYVRHVGVGDLMFGVLFYSLADLLITHPNFTPEWLEIEGVMRHLIPDTCFQELKEATSRKLGRSAAGPFGDPVQPLDNVVIPLDHREGGRMGNKIWDYRNLLLAHELWRLWNFVLREICDQHAAIDCEEQSNVALALIALNPFDRLAGRMFYEASEVDVTRVPDDVFISMGRELDGKQISLADNLDAKGREILKYLGRKGKSITSWEIALADRSERSFLPERAATRDEATTLKKFGTLSRCAKRAFYHAKDAYQRALERVYEQRIPAPIKKNPFESRL
jgi:hypothetical protein